MSLPFVVPLVAVVLGMHSVFFVPNVHNLIWESVYGVGYYVSGFIFRPYTLNPTIGLIGFILWPLIATVIVSLLTLLAIRASPRWRILALGVFVVSLLIWIDDAQANELCRKGWPIFYNYYFVNF